MWDVNVDVPALPRDFYNKAFGPAANVIELCYSNMIQVLPLLGKAILRRFKKFEPVLASRPEVQHEGQGWRQITQPPSNVELAALWHADRNALRLTPVNQATK